MERQACRVSLGPPPFPFPFRWPFARQSGDAFAREQKQSHGLVSNYTALPPSAIDAIFHSQSHHYL